MILTETVHHTHNHGASGWEIYLWVLAAISTMWLLEDGWERATNWWRNWRTEHGSKPTRDHPLLDVSGQRPISDEPPRSQPVVPAKPAGGWTPPETPTRGAAAEQVALQVAYKSRSQT